MDFSKYTRFVILLTKTELETTKDVIIRHVEHLRKLDNDGKLVLSGPFTDFPAGMVVVNATSKAEAEQMAKADPFVVEGVRTYEVRSWLLACAENNYLA